MIKKLAWNTFKNTGDINTYLEFVEAENIENKIKQDLLISEEKIKSNLDPNININE